MNDLAVSALTARVVMLNERDMLSLEWELHHVRWLMGDVRTTVESVSEALTAPPPPPDPEPIPHYWTPRADVIAHRQRIISEGPAGIHTAFVEHAREREWLRAHKTVIKIADLRKAVHAMMAKAGGASVGDFEVGPDPRGEGAIEIRQLRWLLSVRAEIAQRRMRCGEFALILAESTAHENDREHMANQVRVLAREVGHPMREYDLMNSLTDERLLSLRAAAAYGVTGAELVPIALDLTKIGAADTDHAPEARASTHAVATQLRNQFPIFAI
jgi:hypothetical protein